MVKQFFFKLTTFKILLFVILTAIALSSNSEAQNIPENASSNKYDFLNGWSCNFGYKKSGQTCVKIIVPSNASHSKYDYVDGWVCDHGYIKKNKTCIKILVPENAKLNNYNYYNGWSCNSGFKKAGNMCLEIVVPADASLNPYNFTDGWTCNRGFLKSNELCVEVIVPKNASLNSNSQGWVCDAYFKQKDKICIPMNDVERTAYDAGIVRLQRAIFARKLKSLATQHCDTELDTDSEVCVRVKNSEINCEKSYDENYYDSCEVEVNYIVETDYSGNGSIDVDIRCDVEVEFDGASSYSGSDDEDFNDTITVYAEDVHSGSHEVDFNFSYEEPTQVSISDVKCKIKDLYR